MDIIKLARENAELTIGLRRHLHRRPELSRLEIETLKFIKKHLSTFGIPYVEVTDGGIIGFIGDESAGKTVLLRADIDALPIQENKCNLKQERSVISEIAGVQHACGHDAHTAMLLTAGKILRENERELGGRVLLMFERGEEGGGNIHELLRYIRERELRIDGAHAIHVVPSVHSGRLLAKKGPFMAGAAGFSVKITGKDGHASRPDLANNPLDCFVSIYDALNGIRLRTISPFETLTFSISLLQGGIKSNVIPNELTFGGSARFYKKETGLAFVEEFRHIVECITAAYHCAYEIKGLLPGHPLINDDTVTGIAQNSIRSHLGETALLPDSEPLMGSESFSRVAALYPSVMIGLGIRNEELGAGASLHSEFFDLDEGALYLGVAETVGFAIEFLNHEKEGSHGK